jgi:hypothetical protein
MAVVFNVLPSKQPLIPNTVPTSGPCPCVNCEPREEEKSRLAAAREENARLLEELAVAKQH